MTYYEKISPTSLDENDTQAFFDENPKCFGTNSPTPLLQAHSHNDYEHEHPLHDALAQGFTYIEADVYLIDDEIYVSHNLPIILDSGKTLKNLYLDPLAKRIKQNAGQVYLGSDFPLQLMIDIKSEANPTYNALKKLLEPYQYMLTRFKNGKKSESAITVFLSGNRPVEQILSEENTVMCLDGRIEDLGKRIPADLMPVVSERFSNIFGWEIFGQSRTENQWAVLQRLANLTHHEGKKLRLWASPEEEKIWEKMLEAGCDIINTNELEKLRHFLTVRKLSSIAEIH